MTTESSSPPRVFISYSWTNQEHSSSVLALADQLIQNGVEVIIDQYDLRPGHDANAFMESMVTDPAISRVLVICDKAYAEKADARRGGVGTESQIISSEVYQKAKQEKFIPVIFELDGNGKAYLPVFLRGRFYIDMSSPALAGANYDQLLRLIHGRPAKQKPQLGIVPSYLLADTIIQTQTAPLFRTARDALQASRPHASSLVRDYLIRFGESLEDARLKISNKEPVDEQVLSGIRSLLPHRDEFADFISLLADYADTENSRRDVFEFFQGVLRYFGPPEGVSSWREESFDNYRFFAYELFLYTVAVLVKKRRYGFAANLLEREYYFEQRGGESFFDSFTAFRPYLKSLDEFRNRRLGTNRTSVTADLLKERAAGKVVSFDELTEVDFALFLRSELVQAVRGSWFPNTLVYVNEFKTLRMFRMAESKVYFDELKILIGVNSKAELMESYEKSDVHRRRSDSISFSQGFHRLSVPHLGNFDKLDTRP